MLEKRIKLLEENNQPSVEALISKLTDYSLRKMGDFDKYRAIAILEDFVALAQQKSHDKTHYYKIVLESLKERFDKPAFRPYYRALVGDPSHSKVMEALAKVDKSTAAKPPRQEGAAHSSPSKNPTNRPARRCFYCGYLGYVASQCRRRAWNMGRFKPHSQVPLYQLGENQN